MQFELPVRPVMAKVDPDLIAKQPSMSKALALCQTLSGKDDKFNQFMDIAGNEAPMLWLLHSRGYDLNVLRKLETETERKLRLTEEALAIERQKVRVLTDAINGKAA